MKKQMSSFVSAKNMHLLLKKDWQNILADVDVYKLAKDMCVCFAEPEIQKNTAPELLSLSHDSCYQWTGTSHGIMEFKLNFPNLKVSDLFVPVYHPTTKRLKGVAFNSPYLVKFENSPLDILMDENIEESFSVKVMDKAIYPSSGFKYWGNLPQHTELFERLGVKIGEEIFWNKLHVIYRNTYPRCDPNNVAEYYKNLIKLGLTPSLDPFGYFACLTAGILADGATVKDFETYARQSIITY